MSSNFLFHKTVFVNWIALYFDVLFYINTIQLTHNIYGIMVPVEQIHRY